MGIATAVPGSCKAPPLTYGKIGLKGKNLSTPTYMPIHKLTAEILNAAIEGFESQKLRIDAQIAELWALLPGGRTEPGATPEGPKGKRRKMSAAARKRIGDAQRKRWAASKRTSPAASSEARKRKRKLSAAGKRAIVEATKKRWAAFHAAKKAETPTVARKRAAKKTATKKAPVKASRNAAKKGAATRPQKAAVTPALPAATE